MKRLYKIEEGKKLCGVCGGFAEYFNIDPVIVRLVIAALCLINGIGIVLYFIAACIMPKKSEAVNSQEQSNKAC